MFFATFFDKNYISRAEVMITSLKGCLGNNLSKLFILCLDSEVEEYFMYDDSIELIRHEDLEKSFPQLLDCKSNRTYIEYLFTLSPFLPLYILKKYSYVDRITTLDSDLLFFKSPQKYIDSLGRDKIGITKHDFPSDLMSWEQYGKYNVSFQSFPNTSNGLKCLEIWCASCQEYCGDYLDDLNRYADQKYLDSWNSQFEEILEFPTPEIGLAPWNLKKFDIRFEDQNLYVKNKEVVFFHFHGFKVKSIFHSVDGLLNYNFKSPSDSVKNLYFYYWHLLKKVGHKNDSVFVRYKQKVNSLFITFIKDLISHPVLIKLGGLQKRTSFYKLFK